MDYAATVKDLDPTPVWCLTADGDAEALNACNSVASRDGYRPVIYPGISLHGMMLIAPQVDPQPLTLLQEFLELVFEEPVK